MKERVLVKKIFHRVIACMMAVVVCWSSMPVSYHAEVESEQYLYVVKVTDKENSALENVSVTYQIKETEENQIEDTVTTDSEGKAAIDLSTFVPENPEEGLPVLTADISAELDGYHDYLETDISIENLEGQKEIVMKKLRNISVSTNNDTDGSVSIIDSSNNNYVDGDVIVDETTVTIAVEASEGNDIKTVKINETEQEISDPDYFETSVTVQEDLSVSVSYTKKKYDVDVVLDGLGVVKYQDDEITDKFQVEHNDTPSVSFQPNQGWYLKRVELGSDKTDITSEVDISDTEMKYSFDAIKKDQKICATFSQYKLAVVSDEYLSSDDKKRIYNDNVQVELSGAYTKSYEDEKSGAHIYVVPEGTNYSVKAKDSSKYIKVEEESMFQTQVTGSDSYELSKYRVSDDINGKSPNSNVRTYTTNFRLVTPDMIPEISFQYAKDKASEAKEGYFNQGQVAIITIKDKETNFDEEKATSGIKIDGKDAQGDTIDTTGMISSWEQVQTGVYQAKVSFREDGKYTWSVEYTNKADLSESLQEETLTIDKTAPTASITADGNTWKDKIVDVLTFNIFKNYDVTVSASGSDNLSEDVTITYYKSSDSRALTVEELDEIYEENSSEFSSSTFTLKAIEKSCVYARVVDWAGNVTYISTDGILVESTPMRISLATDMEGEYSKKDVVVSVDLSDIDGEGIPYSDLKEAKYKIWEYQNGTDPESVSYSSIEAQEYTLDVSNGESAGTYQGQLNVPSEEFHSNNVAVTVWAQDKAKNFSQKTITMKIDTTHPQIKIEYDNNNALSDTYFAQERTATITVNEHNFTEDGVAITVEAQDINNNELEIDDISLQWQEQDGENADVHVATVTFCESANYTFAIECTDLAGNKTEAKDSQSEHVTIDCEAPFQFAVDLEKPEGKVTADQYFWTKLLNTITFGIYRNYDYVISVDASDRISAVKAQYFISGSKVALSRTELDEVTTWIDYSGEVKIEEESVFVVYVKLTDEAGNVDYICSDGMIKDTSASSIVITPDEANENGFYNSDVNVNINVTEPGAYSGIKTVEYKVWNNAEGQDIQKVDYDNITSYTAQQVLYSYNYERDIVGESNGGKLTIIDYATGKKEETNLEGTIPAYDLLKQNWNGNIVINASENDSNNIVLSVRVTDCAGNKNVVSSTLKIDHEAPELSIQFDDAQTGNTLYNGRYFHNARTATVIVKERNFDANKVTFTAQAQNAQGKDVADAIPEKLQWTDIGDDKHKADIVFAKDANYTWSIQCVDSANNKVLASNTSMMGKVEINNSAVPYAFTIDSTAPTAELMAISAEENTQIWKTRKSVINYGFWSAKKITLSREVFDETSDVQSVYYCKMNNLSEPKSVTELNNLPSENWKKFDAEFNLKANQQVVVYVKVIDFAQNVRYISSDGMIVDDTAPREEAISPRVTVKPEQPVNDFYNKDVKVDIEVEDPTINETSSGLKKITYRILNLEKETQSGTLYEFTEKNPTQNQLEKTWSGSLVVDSNKNNSNQVVIEITATDNSGNVSSDTEVIKIDKTAPSISISYDNNDGDSSYQESTYFKATRTATIVIKERNFNKKNVVVKVTNSEEEIPKLSSWKRTKGTGNEDDTLHTATITYSQDGDYTFEISYKDQAGNKNKKVNYGNSLAPEKFTIDRTVPTVSVRYEDTVSAQNTNYYSAGRTAVVTIREHNFDEGRVSYNVSDAVNNGQAVSFPEIGSWSSNGDVHEARIIFSDNAKYDWSLTYNDKAGNEIDTMTPDSFYIDTNAPVVKIQGINNHSAHNEEGNIGLSMQCYDMEGNYSSFQPKLSAVVRDGTSYKTVTIDEWVTSSITNGMQYTITNLKQDAIYSLTCNAYDLAGNMFDKVLMLNEQGEEVESDAQNEDELMSFSVNREGSYFWIENDQYTQETINDYYVYSVNEDLEIYEVDVDPLDSYRITLNDEELTQGTDYQVKPVNEDGSWSQYCYTVNKELFETEGSYNLIVESTNKAQKTEYSDVKNVKVNFVVDKTAPTVTLSGIDNNGRYQTQVQSVQAIPADDNGALKSFKAAVVDESGTEEKVLVEYSDEELTKQLAENNGQVDFEIPNGIGQNIKIMCCDYAKQEDGSTNTYEEMFTNITVSTNSMVIFFANKPLFYGVIGGGVGSVAVVSGTAVYFGRRRKHKIK